MSAKVFARMVGGSALALGLAFSAQPAALAEPAVSVTPSTGLSEGQVVQVTGNGLTPGTTYHVGQCAQVETGEFPCNTATQQHVVADSDGTVSIPLSVFSTFEGSRPDGSTWGTVDCSVHGCAVGLGDDNGNGGGVLISFK